MPTSSREHQTRPLTPRERETLTALLERGTDSDTGSPATVEDRARWLGQLPETLAGRPCGCGTCPSIELTDIRGYTAATSDRRVILQAEAPGALLMLFIDNDQLSYLELAPLENDNISVLPPATEIQPI